MQSLHQLIQAFAASNRTPVHVSTYANAWPEVANIMLYRFGPDVSEVGSTWVKSLAATNGLLPFPPYVLQALGGQAAFAVPPAYGDDGQIYSIPFQVETRLVFYRRDLLAAAGIDESAAFTSPANFLNTLAALSHHGNPHPLLLPVFDRWLHLSCAASWVWGAGGDFIAPDGKHVIFDQEPALRGLADFFSTARYISPETLKITDYTQRFGRGFGAVTLGGPWVHDYLFNDSAVSPAMRDSVGIALPPGPTYQGSTHLIVWKHSPKSSPAMDLVRYMTGPHFQAEWVSGILPARREVLQSPFYADHPVYKTMIDATLRGRSYSSSSLWGVVEDRLSKALREIWSECLQDLRVPPADILAERLPLLARRINLTLEA